MTPIPQSATSISNFKLCPMKYNLSHVLRLRPIEDSAALRQGTNWHKCLEILTDPSKNRQALIDHIDQAYATCPPSVELVDWEVEKLTLLYSALGWQWRWQDDPFETIASEIPFERTLSKSFTRRGRIDRIIRWNDRILLGEYKSTSKPIDPGSAYWDQLKLDSQLTLYLIEARHAQQEGRLEEYGVSATDPLISGVLYDVWHKPGISPRKLTQADSKKFAKTGEYMGEEFKVISHPALGTITINDVKIEIELGKKEGTFAIRETPEMFGARLLADIQEHPEKHFARKEIPRTDEELARFDIEYHNIARVAHLMQNQNLWFINEHQCNATYRCQYHQICWYNLDVENGNIPEGFKRV